MADQIVHAVTGRVIPDGSIELVGVVVIDADFHRSGNALAELGAIEGDGGLAEFIDDFPYLKTQTMKVLESAAK